MWRLAMRILLLALLQLPLGIESATYEVIGNEKMFVTRCEGEDNKGNVEVSELVDLSQLKLQYEDDYETLHLSGKIVLKKELQNPIKLHIVIYRWVRDKWAPTDISLKRDDFCKSLRNPFEPWHLFLISQIPQEELICPPKLGHVYTLQNITNRLVVKHLPYWDIEGELKAVMHFSAGTLKTCLVALLTVVRK